MCWKRAGLLTVLDLQGEGGCAQAQSGFLAPCHIVKLSEAVSFPDLEFISDSCISETLFCPPHICLMLLATQDPGLSPPWVFTKSIAPPKVDSPPATSKLHCVA